MFYVNYDGLAYFKYLLSDWVDHNYLSKTDTGNLTVAGHVTFTKPITGNIDGKAKSDWLGQRIDSTYIKDIAVNEYPGQLIYTKGDGTTDYVIIDKMTGATATTNGKSGLVPAPTKLQYKQFLRGDGMWATPDDIYVNQQLINSDDFYPILVTATAGANESLTNSPIAFNTHVAINPYEHSITADHLFIKHPSYYRTNTVSSKVQYTLNFTDNSDGAGRNLSEIVGYIDPAADGGEHELGFRLFGNPNVQGVDEGLAYLSVGLSKTNVAYGHAPSTPLPSKHNEGTDIITRDWLARNGSETGLVHTSMNETISGIKTFTSKTENTSSDGIVTTKLTASGKITGTGTAEISGGSGNTPSLKVTGNETVTGNLSVGGNETVGGNISTTDGNITTTNGTISGKTGNIGSGGLAVAGNETVGGTLTVTGKITGNGGINTTNVTASGTTTTKTLHVTENATIDGNETVKGDETVNGDIIVKGSIYKTSKSGDEYVSYITNQQNVRETIINNLLKANGGLAQDSTKHIYVKTGDGIQVNSSGYVTTRLQSDGGLKYTGSTANLKELAVNLAVNGGLVFQSGAIKVDFSRLPEAQIKAIVDGMIAKDPSTGKYTGGLSTNEDGKLVVDFNQLPPEKIRDIAKKITAPGGGIYYVDDQYLEEGDTYVDSSGNTQTVTAAQAGTTTNGFPNPNFGKLLVDFSKMPEDKFDQLKASLGMQRTVTSSTRTFYVDYDNLNASDTIYSRSTGFDGLRGLSLDRPFKTINGAIASITTYYSIGNQNVTVYVVPRTSRTSASLVSIASATTLTNTNKERIAKLFNLNASSSDISAVTEVLTSTQKSTVLSNLETYPYYYESITLPTYNRTSGYITIRGYVNTANDEIEYNSIRGTKATDYKTIPSGAAPMPKLLCKSLCGTLISVNGRYSLRYLDLYNRVRDPATSSSVYPQVIGIGSTSGDLYLYGVHEHFEFYGHTGKVGTLTISNVTTEPTTIIVNTTASTTNAKDVVLDGEYQGYKYIYNTSSGSEQARERPELKLTNSYVTITGYKYDATEKQVILTYTLSCTSDDVTSVTFYYRIDSGSFVAHTTLTYDDLSPATNIQMRTNCVVGGKLYLGIIDNCSNYFQFNTNSDNNLDPNHGNLSPAYNLFPGSQSRQERRQVNNWVVLRAERGGQIENASNATIGFPYTHIFCVGTANHFLELSANASYCNVSGQRCYMHYVVPAGKTVIGYPFQIGSGCGCSVACALTETAGSNGTYSYAVGTPGHAFLGSSEYYGIVENEATYPTNANNISTRVETNRYSNAGSYYLESTNMGSEGA